MNPQRRGACPAIDAPMLTGDGLLVRLVATTALPIDSFLTLCEASAAHGNGVIEITQRGSLQIRGLSPASASSFRRTAVALGLGGGGTPLLTAPLLGSGADSAAVTGVVAELRTALQDHSLAAALHPKVSVLIDGGGELHLDDLAADLRLRSDAASRFHLSIAGRADTATSLGWIECAHVVGAVVRILNAIARRGPAARAYDLTLGAARDANLALLGNILIDAPPPPPRPRAELLGTHRLNNGRVARGIGLAFGHADVGALERLAHAAARCGAHALRPASGRALLAVGLSAAMADEFAAAAAADDFIIRPEDVRRSVVACAGAPACRSATLSTRGLAADIADAAGPLLDGSIVIHVSGCPKGCAHPGAAALTLVGADRLVVAGRAGDPPHGTLSPATLVAALTRLELHRARAPAVERSADMISALGPSGVLRSLGGESLA